MVFIMDDFNLVIVIVLEEGKVLDFVRRQIKVEVLVFLFLKCKKNEMFFYFFQIFSVVIGVLNEVILILMGIIY